MDYKKDNFSLSSEQKKAANALVFGMSYTLGSFAGNESTALVKRTEKLGTAIYLVSDCIDESEPLRNELRARALESLSLGYELLTLGGVARYAKEGELAVSLLALRSFVSLAYSSGLMSDMNGSILIKEITDTLMAVELARKGEQTSGGLGLRSHQGGGDMTLTEDFFDKHSTASTTHRHAIPDVKVMSDRDTAAISKDVSYKGQSNRHDGKGHNETETAYKGRFENTKDIPKEFSPSKSDLALRIARRNTILRLIKDKREVTIKDISSVVSDYSEKTIQRELLALVSEGVLNKTGEKRWSRYTLKG